MPKKFASDKLGRGVFIDDEAEASSSGSDAPDSDTPGSLADFISDSPEPPKPIKASSAGTFIPPRSSGPAPLIRTNALHPPMGPKPKPRMTIEEVDSEADTQLLDAPSTPPLHPRKVEGKQRRIQRLNAAAAAFDEEQGEEEGFFTAKMMLEMKNAEKEGYQKGIDSTIPKVRVPRMSAAASTVHNQAYFKARRDILEPDKTKPAAAAAAAATPVPSTLANSKKKSGGATLAKINPLLAKQRNRNFCFTLFGVAREEMQTYVDQIMGGMARYVIVGFETSPTTGRTHFQGQVCYTNARTFQAVSNALTYQGIRPHLEITKDLQASIEYCMKEGDYIEMGDAPMTQQTKGEMEKNRWAEVLTLTRAGRIEEVDARIQVTHFRQLQHIYAAALNKKQREDVQGTMNWWFVGPTRTGKSRLARRMFGFENEVAPWKGMGVYVKDAGKWWDHYADEPFVIIDEVPRMQNSAEFTGLLKKWTDRYPYKAEVKGGTITARPTCMILTSNWFIQDIVLEATDVDALHERITEVYMPGVGKPHEPRFPCMSWAEFQMQEGMHPAYEEWINAQKAQQLAHPAQPAARDWPGHPHDEQEDEEEEEL
jgi:hypothetical protein